MPPIANALTQTAVSAANLRQTCLAKLKRGCQRFQKDEIDVLCLQYVSRMRLEVVGGLSPPGCGRAADGIAHQI